MADDPTAQDAATAEYRAWQELIASYPAAIDPFYRHKHPDDRLGLYRGRILLAEGGRTSELSGLVSVEWKPRPAVFFHGINPTPNDPFGGFRNLGADLEGVSLPDLGRRVPSQLPDAEPPSLDGQFGEERSDHLPSFAIDDGRPLNRVVFGIVNFHDVLGRLVRFGDGVQRRRLVLEGKPWRVIVDACPDVSATIKELESEGGYAITHDAQLQRLDGQPFTRIQAERFLDGFTHYLWFARGLRASPFLPVGFDDSDAPVWTRWEMRSLDRWATPYSWVDKIEGAGSLESAFRGFVKRWRSTRWRDPMILAINYYLDANSPSTINSGLVSAQIALELLAWTYLVEDQKLMSESDFDGRFSDTLRLLLKQFNLELAIPPGLARLRRAAAARNWTDGPHALTSLRNEVVHLRRRTNAEFPVWIDAWRLATWYLELVLLALLGHEGTYSSRLRDDHWVGQIENVPWSGRSD